MVKENNVLVSVLVISYNAEKYIVDLLESIGKQTYRNLELIIADDGSRDKTVEIVRKWTTEHAARFYNVCIMDSEKNRGTVRNLNRGLQACSGEYIKVIAADDMLMTNCISDLVDYCESHKLEFVLGDVQRISDQGEILPDTELSIEQKAFYEMDAQQQYCYLLKSNPVISPGEIYKKDFLIKYDGFDENYHLIEDYPFWLRITKDGNKINFLQRKVVYYRESATSVANPDKAEKIYNELISKDAKKIFYKMRIQGLIKHKCFGFALRNIRRFFVRDMVILFGNSNKNIFCKVLRKIE